MTISSQTSKAAFSGNGVSTAFPLPFPYLREADIKALLRHEGFETPLVLGTHYSLSGAGSAQGGALVMNLPPATGQTLVIYRAPAIVQEVDYVENSAFPAETHEAALDLLTMICQSLQEQLGRAVLYPVSTPADDVLDSHAFLAATAHSRDAARVAEQNAAGSAGQAGLFASQAAASAASAEAVASTADGLVKVSVGDAAARSLSSKLLAGNGLAEGIENPGGDEALRLAVALADDSGLEFEAGLLRVKAGTGLVRAASGLAADAGTGPGQLVRLDASGKLQPSILPTSGDRATRDNAAMNAFLSWLSAGRATGPVPGGGLYTLKTDELTNVNGTYDAAGDYYYNETGYGADVTTSAQAISDAEYSAAYSKDKAFDKNGATYWGASAPTTAGVDYIGQDFGSGVAKRIRRMTLLQPGSNYVSSVKVQYSDNGTSWSDAGTFAVTTATVHTIDIDDHGAHRYWILRANSAGAGPGGAGISTSNWGVQEVTMHETLPAANMTLTPAAGIALGSVPAKASLYLLHKAVDALTLNTDIKVSASRGGGWVDATDLTALCQFDADYTLLCANVDLSALPSGSTISWRVQTFNNKSQRVRGALLWAE